MQIKTWKFPAGELGIRLEGELWTEEYTYKLNFKDSDSLVEMLLFVDAFRRTYPGITLHLLVRYFPYARQDRVMQSGESHSLKVVANLINSCKFTTVTVVDAHSNVVEALVDNLRIIPQHVAVTDTLLGVAYEYDYLIAPDAGALKKIYKLSQATGIPVICATKQRDIGTGKIAATEVSEKDYNKIEGSRLLVVDDICDGGATFLELAKALPKSCQKDLYVTHGIFSKGKEELLLHYNEIFCYNDMSLNTKG